MLLEQFQSLRVEAQLHRLWRSTAATRGQSAPMLQATCLCLAQRLVQTAVAEWKGVNQVLVAFSLSHLLDGDLWIHMLCGECGVLTPSLKCPSVALAPVSQEHREGQAGEKGTAGCCF